MISSLPSKASRKLVEAEPDKLDIKKRKPGIPFISFPVDPLDSNWLL